MKKQIILFYALLSIIIVSTIYYFNHKSTYDIYIYTKSFENIDLSLMFTDKGIDDYSDKTVQTSKLYRSQFFSKVIFNFTDVNKLKNMRIDFGDISKNNLFIKHLIIVNNISPREADTLVAISGGKKVNTIIQKLENTVTNSITENAISFTTTTTDGYIVLNNNLFTQVNNAIKERNSSNNFLFSLLFTILVYSFFLCTFLVFIHYMLNQYFISIKYFFENYFLILSFWSVIFIMFINFQFGFIGDIENKEKRKIPAQPVLTKTPIHIYPQAFDRFFEVTFPLRNWLFNLNAQLKYRVFHSSPLPDQIILGKDNFLFENESAVISDYTNTTKLDTSVAEIIQPIFLQRKNWLDKKGIKFYLLYAPNKNQVYPEMMPSSYSIKGPGSGINQLTFYTELMHRSNICVINPIENLKKAKSKHPVYYKSDTHWNLYGGFIAYQVLMDSIRKDFPEIGMVKEDELNYSTKFSDQGDLAYMSSIEKSILREDVYLSFKDPNKKIVSPKSSELFINMTNDNPIAGKKLKIIMFRDSYANYLIPFVNLHFSEAKYIWSYEFMDEIIEKEKPDIVVFECLQRFIPYGSLIANSPVVYK